MVYAERGNRVLEIPEELIQRYVDQGYKIVTKSGVVLQDTIPSDLPTLTLEYKKRLEEVKSLKAQLDNAKAEINKLNTEIEALKVAATKVEAPTTTKVEATTEPNAPATKKARSTKTKTVE